MVSIKAPILSYPYSIPYNYKEPPKWYLLRPLYYRTLIVFLTIIRNPQNSIRSLFSTSPGTLGLGSQTPWAVLLSKFPHSDAPRQG